MTVLVAPGSLPPGLFGAPRIVQARSHRACGRCHHRPCETSLRAFGGAAHGAGPPLTRQGRLRRRFATASRPLTREPLRPLEGPLRGQAVGLPLGRAAPPKAVSPHDHCLAIMGFAAVGASRTSRSDVAVAQGCVHDRERPLRRILPVKISGSGCPWLLPQPWTTASADHERATRRTGPAAGQRRAPGPHRVRRQGGVVGPQGGPTTTHLDPGGLERRAGPTRPPGRRCAGGARAR
jgi:hypothetical protein